MKLSITVVILAVGVCFHARSEWPMPLSVPSAKASSKTELAPDVAHQDLPIDHAKLIWFVSARELPRTGVEAMDKVNLGRMLDEDIATCTTFKDPRKYELVIDLQRTVAINRVTLVTDVPGCPMTVRVTGADLSQDEGKGWTRLGETVTKVPFTRFTMRNDPIRFIHVTLDTSKLPKSEPLHLYEFCVFGQEDVRDYVLRQTPEGEEKAREQFVRQSNVGGFPIEMLQSNIASLDAGSSVRHVGGTQSDPKVSLMIDDDPETFWRADPADKETLILVDLGHERKLKNISLMHTARPGKLTAYALKDLPQDKSKAPKLAWLEGISDIPLFRFVQNAPPAGNEGAPQLTSSWLAAQAPFGSADLGSTNYTSFEFEPQSARYVAFHYVNPTPGMGDPLLINTICASGLYPIGEFVLMPRALPIIAGGGGTVGAPSAGDPGIPITDQLRGLVETPKPTPATP